MRKPKTSHLRKLKRRRNKRKQRRIIFKNDMQGLIRALSKMNPKLNIITMMNDFKKTGLELKPIEPILHDSTTGKDIYI
jgi:hypothetical protein